MAVRARLVVASRDLERSRSPPPRPPRRSTAPAGANWARQAARAATARTGRGCRRTTSAAGVRRRWSPPTDVARTHRALPRSFCPTASGTVVDRTSLPQRRSAMDDNYDGFAPRRPSPRSPLARHLEPPRGAGHAEDASQERARAAADHRRSPPKPALIARLAKLHVSVQLAERQQAALERRAAAAPRGPPRSRPSRAEQEEAQQQAEQEAQQQGQRSSSASRTRASIPGPTSEPTSGRPRGRPRTRRRRGPPTTPAPPAPGGGVAAALPSRGPRSGAPTCGARAGPSSWDCSGLTVGAWRAGGKYLPHYSVAQPRAVHAHLGEPAAAR